MTSASVIRLFPGHATTTRASQRRIGVVSRILTQVDRWLCGALGHHMVLQYAPDRLWLRCLSCSAETSGWTLEVTPRFRGAAAARGRVLRYASDPSRPHRSAA